MADATLSHLGGRFPAGTEVSAYPRSNWPRRIKMDASPVGDPVDTQTANGSLTFTGLEPRTRYVAHAEVGGEHRYMGFASTPRHSDIQTLLNPPAARVTHNANQSIPSDTATVLAFNAESFDTADLHDNTTNNSRLTAPVDGLYIATAGVRFVANNTGWRMVLLGRNGTFNTLGSDLRNAASDATATTRLSVSSGPVQLQAGDYMEVRVQQSSGGALNVASQDLFFSMVRVGAL
jgi:hypothetical protein